MRLTGAAALDGETVIALTPLSERSMCEGVGCDAPESGTSLGSLMVESVDAVRTGLFEAATHRSSTKPLAGGLVERGETLK
jgi:hypothetical protein